MDALKTWMIIRFTQKGCSPKTFLEIILAAAFKNVPTTTFTFSSVFILLLYVYPVLQALSRILAAGQAARVWLQATGVTSGSPRQ